MTNSPNSGSAKHNFKYALFLKNLTNAVKFCFKLHIFSWGVYNIFNSRLNFLQAMKPVQCCPRLMKLYLYSNQIDRIEGLDKLVGLETLWLNWNRISSMGGLGNLVNLRELNLAGNCVESVRGRVEHLKKLEVLDLSGNQISSFEVCVCVCEREREREREKESARMMWYAI